MRLYVDANFASPYALVAFVSLIEKGLEFEIEPLDLAAHANHDPNFARTSITRRVPTLIHDNFALSESSAICEYLDETFPGTRLYPTDPHDRARARQIQAWVRSDLMPIRDERPTFVSEADAATFGCGWVQLTQGSGNGRSPEGEPESRLWVDVAGRGHDARTARPDGEYSRHDAATPNRARRPGAATTDRLRRSSMASPIG